MTRNNDLAPVVKGTVWLYVFLFWFIGLLFFFYAPASASFVNSYELSDPPGTLVSRRWSLDFWIIGLYVLLWTVPITAAFAISDPRTRSTQWRPVFHMVVVVVLILWLVAVFLILCVDWANANKTDPSNYYNRANDPRWCCVYFNLPSAPCVNNVGCNPGVTTDDLVTDRSFLFQLWFTFIFIVILMIDLVLMGCMVNPELRRLQRGQQDQEEEEKEEEEEDDDSGNFAAVALAGRARYKRRVRV